MTNQNASWAWLIDGVRKNIEESEEWEKNEKHFLLE